MTLKVNFIYTSSQKSWFGGIWKCWCPSSMSLLCKQCHVNTWSYWILKKVTLKKQDKLITVWELYPLGNDNDMEIDICALIVTFLMKVLWNVCQRFLSAISITSLNNNCWYLCSLDAWIIWLIDFAEQDQLGVGMVRKCFWKLRPLKCK